MGGRHILALIAILSASVLVLASPLSEAESEPDFTVDGLQYNLVTQSGELSVVGYEGPGGDITIPSAITVDEVEYHVSSIEEGAFSGNTAITSIVTEFPLSIVPNQCFKGCTALRSADLGQSMRYIGEEAFMGCSSLVYQIPDSVGSVYSRAFKDCTSIDSENIPAKVDYLGDEAFAGCLSLAEVTFEEGIYLICDGVFTGCTSLTSVELPASLTVFRDCVFSGCTALETINVRGTGFVSDDGVLLSGDSSVLIAYPAGRAATEYTVPATVSSYRPYAFEMGSDAKLVEVTIQSGSVIQENAFRGAGSVVKVALPSSIRELGISAFQDCVSLTDINTGSVEVLGSYCFSGCTSLVTVEIGNSVIRMPAYCFSGCTSLGTIVIPSSVREIRPFVFEGTDGARVDILTNISTVYDKAFITGDNGAITINTVLDTSKWDTADSSVSYNASTFTLTKVLYGDIVETEHLHANDLLDLSDVPVREGYAFTGWDYAPSHMPVGDLTIIAQWTANTYRVVFDSNGGSGTMGDQQMIVGRTIPLATNTYSNGDKVPLGWSDTADGPIRYFECQGVRDLVLSGSVTLYAVWDTADYIITFDPNGGTGSMTSEGFANGYPRSLSPNAFSREGYLFQGWSTIPDGSAQYSDRQLFVSTSGDDMTLYAIWRPISYRIVFNVNGGEGSMEDANVQYEERYILPECGFTRTGYTFVTWSTSSAGTDSFIPGTTISKMSTSNNGTVIFYAVWRANTYTVVFDPNGGSGEMAILPCIYDLYRSIPQCTFRYDGHVFKGWAEEPDGRVVYENRALIHNLTDVNNGTVTLYAVWGEGEPEPVPVGPDNGNTIVFGLAAVAVVVVGLMAFVLVRCR